MSVVIKRAIFDDVRASVDVCAPVRVCACVCVRSLTTTPCHYHPPLLITAETWPVEVHLGSCSHLSESCAGPEVI